MENLNVFLSFNRLIKIGLVGAGLLIFGNTSQAQTPQTFKVAPPAEAKPLLKDSVDNFLSFSPVYVEGKTYLRWLVENDKKDGVFIVERSADGEKFDALGFKDRVGTDKNVNLFYSWVDDAPPAGAAHYRIMQVGVDHTFNYSDVVRVKTSAAASTGGSASSTPEQGK
jgi:hypothetical protein